MSLNISDEYFGELLPFIRDEAVTDITWNGRDLWLDDLDKGRYKSSVKLSNKFVSTFATRIANLANKNFNLSEPLLEAETDDLRISIIDGTVTNTNRSIAIRKTPAVRRLNELKMLNEGYAEAMVLKLFEGLVKGHCSVIVTGDVGSGKTEFVKYLTKFIPSYERTISIEDNYELRLSSINPNLDCVEIKATQDGPFTYQMAIKAALRQLCKWLLMAEARSKEVIQLLEAASTGCIVMTTLHSDDVRKIPDRVVNMMGIDGEEKRNDVYNFFDIGVKIGIQKTEKGIHRSVDQICVLDRDNDVNSLHLIYNHGFTGQTLPKNVWQKLVSGAKENITLFEFLKPDNADSMDYIETPEFADMVTDLEDSMKENLLNETAEKEKLAARYGDSVVEDIDTLIGHGLFGEKLNTATEEVAEPSDRDIDELIGLGVFDDDWIKPELADEADEIVADTFDLDDIVGLLNEENLDEDEPLDEEEPLIEEEPVKEKLPEEPLVDISEYIDDDEEIEEEKKDDFDLEIPDFDFMKDFDLDSELEGIDLEPVEEEPEDINDVLWLFDAIEEDGKVDDTELETLIKMADDLGLGDLDNLTREELLAKLKEQLLNNWINGLSEEELVEELKREISLVEQCNKDGTPIPEYEMAKIQQMMKTTAVTVL